MNTVSRGTAPRWKKWLVGALVLALMLVAVGLIVIRNIGAWNLVFPNTTHETVPPEIPAGVTSPALLLFTKTNGFRHGAGIDAGTKLVQEIAFAQGWAVYPTENGAVFNSADLSRFQAVVFLNASGDILNEQQEADFQAWLQAGGGWLGIHAAGDGSHASWQWYVDSLVGAEFNAHIMGPQFQSATVEVEQPGHIVMEGLPSEWQHEEEWYSWHQSPRDKGFTILATIDEDSYSPWMKFLGADIDLRMGDHPIVWSRCVDSGRALYSAMGHSAAAFEAAEHRQLVGQALAWVMGEAGQPCPSN